MVVTEPSQLAQAGEALCCTPIASGRLDDHDAASLASMFKALGDPVRLRLFAQVAAHGDEVCVCDIGDVGVSQPTVSHHLKKLREAGLVTSERRGTWVYYRAVPEALSALATVLTPETA